MARLPEDTQGDPDEDGEAEAVDPVRGDIVEDGESVEGEVVDDIPARQRVIAATRFSGPLPPPESLREYDEVVPGLAREIVDQWKGETAHRHRTIDGLRALIVTPCAYSTKAKSAASTTRLPR